MKILIVSVDSDIGKGLFKVHTERGDTVETTSRNGNGTYNVELVHPLTWPNLPAKEYDMIYYTIGTNDARVSRMEVMQINAFLSVDFLGTKAVNAVKPGGKIVVLSSGWGSIGSVRSARAPSYRMSKAALNMGIAVLANRNPSIQWLLVHPGYVATKMTRGSTPPDAITIEESVKGIANVSMLAGEQFAFVDYTGATVPF